MSEALERTVNVSSIVRTLIIVLLFIGTVTASWVKTTNHVDDENVHMPLEKKIEIFVTRNEYNQLKEQMDKQHTETMDALREIREKQ